MFLYCLQTLEAKQNRKGADKETEAKIVKESKGIAEHLYSLHLRHFVFSVLFRELSVSSFFGQFFPVVYSESGVSSLFDDVREGLNGISYIKYVMTTRFIRCVNSSNVRTVNSRPRYFLSTIFFAKI